jgi:hypothetical protein
MKRRLVVAAGVVVVLVMLASLVSIALSQRTIASEEQTQTKCARATALGTTFSPAATRGAQLPKSVTNELARLLTACGV